MEGGDRSRYRCRHIQINTRLRDMVVRNQKFVWSWKQRHKKIRRVNIRLLRSATGGYIFSLFVSLHPVGDEVPHLHPIILRLVPCPFWGVSSPRQGCTPRWGPYWPEMVYPLARDGVPPGQRWCTPWPEMVYPLARDGVHPGIGQQREYLIRDGRYATCVHAGGLSCSEQVNGPYLPTRFFSDAFDFNRFGCRMLRLPLKQVESSGGSRISQTGAQIPKGGRQAIIWLIFFRKMHKNEEILVGLGRGASLRPPLDPPIERVLHIENIRKLCFIYCALLSFKGVYYY